MTVHRLGHMEDHCDACGEPDDGTQSYCECGEPLIDPKHIPSHVERAVAEWEAAIPRDEARGVVAALTGELTRVVGQLGTLIAVVSELQRRLDLVDDQIDQLQRRD